MGRLKRDSLKGLAVLGGRLREIRQAAGLSQMKVAELMGFNPTHGYKYILKLEKGSIPNPTLRTIISFFEVCGADWSELVDAMPSVGLPSGGQSRSTKDTPIPNTGPDEQPLGAAVASVPAEPTTAPRQWQSQDRRPLRIRLREERIAERNRSTQKLWTAVARAETAAARFLRSSRVNPDRHRRYLAVARTCCSTLFALETAHPRAVEKEVNGITTKAANSGLDRAVLDEVVRLCRESLSAPQDDKTAKTGNRNRLLPDS